jgi:hypothetical protein
LVATVAVGCWIAARLFVRGCAQKTRFVFSFSGGEDLRQLRGGRGDHVYFSLEDYPNSMLYLIVRPEDLTVVLDNPDTEEMRSPLGAIHDLLWTDILSTYARAA